MLSRFYRGPVRGHFVAILGAFLLISPSTALSQTTLESIEFSPDTAVEIDGIVIRQRDVLFASVLGGNGFDALVGLLNLPSGASVVGYHRMPDDDRLIAFDTTVVLPAAAGDVTLEPQDVARCRFEGIVPVCVNWQRGVDLGVPHGIKIDALSYSGQTLYLSFDSTTTLNYAPFAAETVDDEDVVAIPMGGIIAPLDGLRVLDGSMFVSPGPGRRRSPRTQQRKSTRILRWVRPDREYLLR